jgi:hypothetical protein
MKSKSITDRLEELMKTHNELKSKVITKGMWRLASSNRDRIRKLKQLDEQIESIRNTEK